MHINISVDGNLFIIRQSFRPFFTIALYRPIILIESAPKDGPSVSAEIVFTHHTAVSAELHINEPDCIICSAIEHNGVSADDI